VRDQASGLNYDPAKLHVLNHKGKHFAVRGPLNVARTPQGIPWWCRRGLDQGRELAAATADVIYAASQTLGDAQAYYASVKDGWPSMAGRGMHWKIMPGLMAITGRTAQEAHDKHDALQELIQPIVGLRNCGVDRGFDGVSARWSRAVAAGMADAQPGQIFYEVGSGEFDHSPVVAQGDRGGEWA